MVRVLRAAVAAERWQRPFLLVGRGEARDGAARAAAKAVLCTGRPTGSGDACLACGACGRFERGLHPDFHVLLPEKGKVGIGVDAVEALQSRLSLRPVEGRATAVLLPDAEALTDQAQNALLKTLEEPPPRTALLLTVAAPRALLATVLSRCAVLRFPPPAAGDPELLAEAEEEGLPGAAAAWARAFAPSAGSSRDPLEHLPPAAAWVKGRGGTLEDQRRRLRLGLRLLLTLHCPGDPASAYNGLPPGARRRRLASLGVARERVERNVDPVGILEALAVAVAAADKEGA